MPPAANTAQPPLASNNPFRNRATSPNSVSPSQQYAPSQPAFSSYPDGPVSATQYYYHQQQPQQPQPQQQQHQQPPLPPQQQQPSFSQQQQPSQPPPLSFPVDLFGDLSIHEQSYSQPQGPSTFQENLRPAASLNTSSAHINTVGSSAGPTASVGISSPTTSSIPTLNHPAASYKPDPPPAPRRRTKEKEPSNQDLLIDIFADPDSKPSQETGAGSQSKSLAKPSRPRRNSDTSVMELDKGDNGGGSGKHGPREERSRQQREQRDRHHRAKQHRTRDGDRKESRQKPRSNRTLDIIDKLDITGVYGSAQFHHDGPFDACNPYRNRKGIRAPPMRAFDEESTSMALGPARRKDAKEKLDYDLYHGRIEKSLDFANDALTTTGVYRPKKGDLSGFDPASRVEPVHGEESMGLGTSTFLEGAPASKAAIGSHDQERRSSHDGSYAEGWSTTGEGGPPAGATPAGGLARKKSLAQKIRGGISRGNGSTREPTRPNNHKVTSSSGSDELPSPIGPGAARPSKGSGGLADSSHDEDVQVKNSGGPDSSSGVAKRNGSGSASGNGLLSRVKSLRKR